MSGPQKTEAARSSLYCLNFINSFYLDLFRLAYRDLTGTHTIP